MRSGRGVADGDSRQDIVDHRRRIRECRNEERTLVFLRVRILIDQELLEGIIAPITNLRLQLEKELAQLTEQTALTAGGPSRSIRRVGRSVWRHAGLTPRPD